MIARRGTTPVTTGGKVIALNVLLIALSSAPAEDTRAEDAVAAGVRRADGVLRRMDFEEGAAFWAFRPPKEEALPAVNDPSWIRQPLDAFVLAGLDAADLKPNARARKTTLLRRVTFDLTGLPPQPQEIEAFVDDTAPTAFDRVVDRLLASPHFGERWGRHWLDVMRYSDSNGLDENIHFGHAWRYRDYVVSAFNRDKPYTRLIAEHVAGDLLGSDGETVEAYVDRVTAGTFLAIGPKMVAEQDDRKRAMDTLDELINVVTRAFLAQTVACARCHDHKYDPISTRDYYALAGVFASAVGDEGLHRSIPVSLDSEQASQLLAHERKLASTLRRLREQALARLAQEHSRAGVYIEDALSLSARTVTIDGRQFSEADGVQSSQYAFEVTEDGAFLLAAAYENQNGVAVQLSIDGTLVHDQAFAIATARYRRGDVPAWLPLQSVDLSAGKHVLTLRTTEKPPRVVRVACIPEDTSSGGSPGWSNRRTDLNPRLLLGWLDAVAGERENADSLLRPLFDLRAGSPERIHKAREIGKRLDALRLEAVGLKRELVEQRSLRAGPAISRLVFQPGAPLAAAPRPELIFPELWSQLRRAEVALVATRKNMRALPQVHAMHQGTPRDLPVHIRGSHLDLESELVPRGFLSVTRSAVGAPEIPDNETGRLQLARWLADPRHPLTARVMVNRVWQELFGVGIVPTASNFGFRGERPSDPALLDHLALGFSRQGWSIKRLIRTIVLSSTYLQASQGRDDGEAKDPQNRLLWRQNRRRLEAEAIRDALLATAGELNPQVGGTIFDFKDGERVTNDQSANASTRTYDTRRRALYLPVIRMALYPMFTDFDLNDTTLPIPRRGSTVVASQALFMMNSPLVIENAATFARKLLGDPLAASETWIHTAYLRAYSRAPTQREVALSLSYLKDVTATSILEDGLNRGRAEQEAWQQFCHALLAANEFIYIN